MTVSRGKKLAQLQEGDFRDLIVIEQPTRTADDRGGQSVAWGTFISPWARIDPQSGDKRMFAGQIRPTVSHKIYIRYQTGVLTTMRVVFGSRTFAILAVIDFEELHEYIELRCEENKPT